MDRNNDFEDIELIHDIDKFFEQVHYHRVDYYNELYQFLKFLHDDFGLKRIYCDFIICDKDFYQIKLQHETQSCKLCYPENCSNICISVEIYKNDVIKINLYTNHIYETFNIADKDIIIQIIKDVAPCYHIIANKIVNCD